MTVQIGDQVWFTSKFGDRVTGIYECNTTMPVLKDGKMVDVEVCRVLSENAFGDLPNQGVTSCLVPINKLNKLEK